MVILLSGLVWRKQSSDSSVRCHIEIRQNACFGKSYIKPQTRRLRLKDCTARRIVLNHKALVILLRRYPAGASSGLLPATRLQKERPSRIHAAREGRLSRFLRSQLRRIGLGHPLGRDPSRTSMPAIGYRGKQ
jgi:hypothetical protein